MKTISTTFPWAIGPPSESVRHAKALRCDDLCIRAVDGPSQFGVDAQTEAQWGGKTQRDLEREAKEQGLTVSIWVVTYFHFWRQEAEAIREAVDYYRPTVVFIDAERKQWVENIGAFLRALGRLPTKVYLQSYRRASLHPEMAWQKWYTYRDVETGEYVIDGLGHQLYPIGAETPEQWLWHFTQDVNSHEREIELAGREDMPWYPTLPTFIGTGFESAPGWRPKPEAFTAGVDWLKETLGERLVGLNFWSLDRRLFEMEDLYSTVQSIALAAPGPEPEPSVVSLEEWARSLDSWARDRGYSGPKPPSAS